MTRQLAIASFLRPQIILSSPISTEHVNVVHGYKSPGYDQINPIILLKTIDLVATTLTKMFNAYALNLILDLQISKIRERMLDLQIRTLSCSCVSPSAFHEVVKTTETTMYGNQFFFYFYLLNVGNCQQGWHISMTMAASCE